MGTDTETGRLRAVLVHRPGAELRRVTPGTRDRLGFSCLPWVVRAQREHDHLTELLRQRGAEVVYLTELLQDVLEFQRPRDEAIGATLASAALGDELGRLARGYLESLPPADLAAALVTGLTPGELGAGRGLVFELLGPHDFVIDPLPGLVFSRESSVPIGDQVIVGGLCGARGREGSLLATVYGHHPRFAGLTRLHLAGERRLDCADVLLLAPGVVAIGVGARTSPAAAEWLAGSLLGAGAARTVLAVPMGKRGDGGQHGGQLGGQLGAACTVIDAATVIMAPALAFTLTALTITARGAGLEISRPMPFLEAAARATGADRLTVIGTGLDPLAGPATQWDDGGGALAIGGRAVVCEERNAETNARLEAAGFEVLAVPASELGGARADRRGGPRCLCAPLLRDPLAAPAADAGPVPAGSADACGPVEIAEPLVPATA